MSGALAGKKGERRLLLGNEAIARGALEAGVKFVSCYPGTPSSEAADALYKLSVSPDKGGLPDFYAEYSVNEKTAMETACGAALAGAPALVTMKHVGLNVAADPLFTAAYIGMPGGLVILSGDDPGCHSSQNEQDNRAYARFAGLPCFEPASAAEAKEMTKHAFKTARELEQPVLLRTTTRISHMAGPVEFGECQTSPAPAFQKNPSRFIPVPANAIKRHSALAGQLKKAKELSEKSPFNKISRPPTDIIKNGIIASGPARAYALDALELEGLADQTAVLELGQTWPLPDNMILDFIKGLDRVLILEEGEPLLEKDIRAMAQKNGLAAELSGKDRLLDEQGEYSVRKIRERLRRWLGVPDALPKPAAPEKLPSRPPNLCPGCAHRSVYYAARKVFGDEAAYSSDIGCYTLGLLPPFKAADFLVCMGSSVTAGAGLAKASGRLVVAFIGDSTFFHSGLAGVASAVFNNHDVLIVILDNGTTAMTGHQPNPGMNEGALNPRSRRLDMEKILEGMGVQCVRTVKAHNVKAVAAAFEELRGMKGPRVLIAREPCLLHARRALKRQSPMTAYVKAQGEGAERCAKDLACPAFTRRGGLLEVDSALCGSCMACVQIAPDFFGAKKRE